MRAYLFALVTALTVSTAASAGVGPWKVEVAIGRPDGQTLRGEVVLGWAVPGTVGRVIDVNRNPFSNAKQFSDSLPVGDEVVVTLLPIRGTRDQMVARVEIWSNDREDIALPHPVPDLASARSLTKHPSTVSDTPISSDGGVLEFLGPNERKYLIKIGPR
ncbi:hypothetical protein [Roseiterribacter gracilis]|uniref:Uncharacterized protein n=1 Tax=Roseiterribacter gracilis TaxID=2812848 RepID=A0A8S8XHT2_9PROT|nr:hypothetical protein TMPK1_37690 [Rhodospirillales bacterium TMPK1]